MIICHFFEPEDNCFVTKGIGKSYYGCFNDNNKQQHSFQLEAPVCRIFHSYSLSVAQPRVS